MKVYCDSSFLVKRVVQEVDSDEVCLQLDGVMSSGGTCVTSALARVEIGRALVRRSVTIATSTMDQLLADALDDLVQVELAPVYLLAATTVRSQHLRTLDAIHVATALLTECDLLLTRDRQLARACDELGLAVA